MKSKNEGTRKKNGESKSSEQNNAISKKQQEVISIREKEPEEVKEGSQLPDIMDYSSDLDNTEIDIILEAHQVNADKLLINVSDIDARVNLNVKAMDFFQIKAGVQVHLDEAEVLIQGVQAEAYLQVRLDRVKSIVDKVMDIDDHADIRGDVLKPHTGELWGADSIVGSTREVLTDLNTKGLTEAAKK